MHILSLKEDSLLLNDIIKKRMMTVTEVKRKFIDRVADGNWELQEFPYKYGLPSIIWLLIWMFDNWNPEIESFVSNFFNPVEFYGWLEENLPKLISEWKKEIAKAEEEFYSKIE